MCIVITNCNVHMVTILYILSIVIYFGLPVKSDIVCAAQHLGEKNRHFKVCFRIFI